MATDPSIFLRGAEVLGHLARVGGTLMVEYVDFEANRALEWIEKENKHNEARRHAGINILKSIATNTPNIFYPRIPQFLDSIWMNICDPKKELRIDSISALESLLSLLTFRPVSEQKKWYEKIYVEARLLLKDKREEFIHGGLLAVGELFKTSMEFVTKPMYLEACELIFKFADSRNPVIQRSVISLYPVLSKYNTNLYETHFLHTRTTHLLHLLKGKEKYHYFRVIGDYILVLNLKFKPHVDQLFVLVRDTIMSKKSAKAIDPSIFYCISCLARGIRNGISSKIRQLLLTIDSVILSSGLTPELVQAYADIVENIPSLLPMIQESLLAQIRAVFLKKNQTLINVVGSTSSTFTPSFFGPVANSASRALASQGISQSSFSTSTNLVGSDFSHLNPGMSFQLVHPSYHVSTPHLAQKPIHFFQGPSNNLSHQSSGPVHANSAWSNSSVGIAAANNYASGSALTQPTSLHTTASTSTASNPTTSVSGEKYTGPQMDSQGYSGSVDPSTLILALKTLGGFDFSGQQLLPFVQDCVIYYLDDEVSDIRETSAITCIQILDLEMQRKVPIIKFYTDILDRLVVVSISDPDSKVRFSIMRRLFGNFDFYLCQSENIKKLCYSLNDECLDVKRLAVMIMGKLTQINPAYAVPPLRKLFIQLLGETEFSTTLKGKEESTQLLVHVITHTKQLMRPYVPSVLLTLKTRLEDTGPGIANNILAAIGELSEVGGEEMRLFVHDILPKIINFLQDPGPIARKNVAISTLSKLCRNTGYVIKPFKTYPNLMVILFASLKSEQERVTRMNFIRAIGTIGAIDPLKLNQVDDEAFEGRHSTRSKLNKSLSKYKNLDRSEYKALLMDFSAFDANLTSSVTFLDNSIDQGISKTPMPKNLQSIKIYSQEGQSPFFANGKNAETSGNDISNLNFDPHLKRLVGSQSLNRSSKKILGSAQKDLGHHPYEQDPLYQNLEFENEHIKKINNELYNLNYKKTAGFHQQEEDVTKNILATDRELLTALGTCNESYYTNIALNYLMRILSDPSLEAYHQNVIQALMYIIRNLDLKTVYFLPKFMPIILQLTRNGKGSFKKTIFSNFVVIVQYVKEHIRPYLYEIFSIIGETWLDPQYTAKTKQAAGHGNVPLGGISKSAEPNMDFEYVESIIPLIKALSYALGRSFRHYLLSIVPRMIKIMMCDPTPQRKLTVHILSAFESFGMILEDYLSLILTNLLNFIERKDIPYESRSVGILFIAKMARKIQFNEYCAMIIQCFNRILATEPDLREVVFISLTAVAYQLKQGHSTFVRLLQKTMFKHKLANVHYDKLILQLSNNKALTLSPDYLSHLKEQDKDLGLNIEEVTDTNTWKKFSVNQNSLKKYWSVVSRNSKDDWHDWMRKLALELLRESSSPALRSCSILAQSYSQLAKDLFNSSFVSCWSELFETNQDDLVGCIKLALDHPNVPSEVTQVFLNLAEFMEHQENKLPLEYRHLGDWAIGCQAFSKALHYKELEFLESKDNPGRQHELLETFISIYDELKQDASAKGILEYIKIYNETATSSPIKIKDAWYEYLQQWHQALNIYDSRLSVSNDADAFLGRMRCLNKIGEWQTVLLESSTRSKLFAPEIQQDLAPVMAEAAWRLARWDALEKFTNKMDAGTDDYTMNNLATLSTIRRREKQGLGQNITLFNRADLHSTPMGSVLKSQDHKIGLADKEELESYGFIRNNTIANIYSGGVRAISQHKAIYQAACAVKNNDYEEALKYIGLKRELLEPQLTATFEGENYTRAFKSVFKAQVCTELEEVIRYKQADMAEMSQLKKTWAKRLRGTQKNIEVWHTLLQIRSLVLQPSENEELLIKFSSICRDFGQLTTSKQTLLNLFDSHLRLFPTDQAPFPTNGTTIMPQRYAAGGCGYLNLAGAGSAHGTGQFISSRGIASSEMVMCPGSPGCGSSNSVTHSASLGRLTSAHLLYSQTLTQSASMSSSGSISTHNFQAHPSNNASASLLEADTYPSNLNRNSGYGGAISGNSITQRLMSRSSSSPNYVILFNPSMQGTEQYKSLLLKLTKASPLLSFEYISYCWAFSLEAERLRVTRARKLLARTGSSTLPAAGTQSRPDSLNSSLVFPPSSSSNRLSHHHLGPVNQYSNDNEVIYLQRHPSAAAVVHGHHERVNMMRSSPGFSQSGRPYSLEQGPIVDGRYIADAKMQGLPSAGTFGSYDQASVGPASFATRELQSLDQESAKSAHYSHIIGPPAINHNSFTRQDCIQKLDDFISVITSKNFVFNGCENIDAQKKLLAKSFKTIGSWHMHLYKEQNAEILNFVLFTFTKACSFAPGWYKAWNSLAQINLKIVSFFEKKKSMISTQTGRKSKFPIKSQQRVRISTYNDIPPAIDNELPKSTNAVLQNAGIQHTKPPQLSNLTPMISETKEEQQASNDTDSSMKESDALLSYYEAGIKDAVIRALNSFFNCMILSGGNSLQDTLRTLTLLFKHGANDQVLQTMQKGIKKTPIETWLYVIPQLIARIHIPLRKVRHLVHDLLVEVGNHHPQALIYSLTVAAKSQGHNRKEEALAIVEKLRGKNARLVDQALLVSNELIRVAILWHELWHVGLEEASRLWFGDRDFKGMMDVLHPLHELISGEGETLREISFLQAYSSELREAFKWITKYKQTKANHDIEKAWETYYIVFKKISAQMPQLTNLELQYVSPRLLEASNLELAVPGLYLGSSETNIVRIMKFSPVLNVISSKQRPRKLSLIGSDGQLYVYLLKGHEDLRQDERVMQLFDLLNSLLSQRPETFKKRLKIKKYAVIPLSTKSGLIGWVPNCDTLHTQIKEYRDSKKILLNLEHKMITQMAPTYDLLPVPNKLEVFENALRFNSGHDLSRILWLKSANSSVWLDKRTNYTRSLAVMSMVGYILGLGDRHPSNIMIERQTGKIVHIDFGDCFEIAMHRDKFPERVPFRLTRMLVNAMEVSGIEGNFRSTCVDTMSVLRENRDSLMAVLEAFVYDPLINWRLVENTLTNPSPIPAGKTVAILSTTSSVSTGLKSGTDGSTTPDSNRKKSEHKEGSDDEVISMGNFCNPDILGMSLRAPSIREPQKSGHGHTISIKAVKVINRVEAKLDGQDYNTSEVLTVEGQVKRLIQDAISKENLCQAYVGWCPFW